MATVEITGSECKMIKQLTESLPEITVTDIFKGHTKNPIFKCTEQAHCHLCCPVPIAVVKAVEVVLELALPQDVQISFE